MKNNLWIHLLINMMRHEKNSTGTEDEHNRL
jgi:hypothetical protein